MTTTLGSGQGVTATAKTQGTWGGTFMSTGQETLIFKTAKIDYDPNYVQGGPYLNGGQLADLATTNVLTWQNVKVTLTGDMTTTKAALMLKCALGTSATMTQIGTTTAYGLGGTTGATGSAPDINSTYMDLQLGIPTTDATINPFSFHSGVIQKAEWVFDRAGIVTYTYDFMFQQMETATGYLAPTVLTNPSVFAMATTMAGTGSVPATTSGIAIGTYNSEAAIDGIRKATFTLDRKLGRVGEAPYLSEAFVSSPITAGLVDLTVALDVDYTPAVLSSLWAEYVAGTSTSIFCQSAGAAIGSSGKFNTFSLQTPAVMWTPGGDPSPNGPELIRSTMTGKGKIDPAGDPWLNAILLSADTSI